MAEQVEYPQTYRNDDGVELIASNEIQAHVYKREGFKLVNPEIEPEPAKKNK